MTSRERLMTVLKGGIPDRVPVSCYELVGYDSHCYCNNEPSYSSLMDYIRSKTDCVALWRSANNSNIACTAYKPETEIIRTELPDGYSQKTVIKAGGKSLQKETRKIKGIYTTWTTQHLCKDSSDIEAVMSMPFVPYDFGNDDAERVRGELGDNGILMPSIYDPAYLAMSMMEFGESLVWVMTETDYFSDVVKELHKRNMINLERMLQTTPGDIYRICGPEYMCPPYMPPEYFERFMLPYLTEMTDLIHRYGRMVRIHSHGKIGKVAEMIAETGCDGTDPCEERPDGDIGLAELKTKIGDRVTLFGSMQLKLLENGTREEVIAETKRMMREGKPGGRFVIMPTASPINVPLAPHTEDNYRAFIDTALSLADY